MGNTHKPPNTGQLSDMFSEMRKAIDDLEAGARVEITSDNGRTHWERTPSLGEMISMCAAAARDGFPTSSRSEGGAPSSVLDDEGKPMPPLSDPTGELVVAEHRIVDPIRIHGESMLRGFTGALGDLRMARASMIRASKYAEATKPPEPGCVSHERIGVWLPVDRSNRCRWCYNFALAEHQDPPEALLTAREEGTKITQRMVDDALRAPKKPRRLARAG